MNKPTYHPEFKYIDVGLAGETEGGWKRFEISSPEIEKKRRYFKNTDFATSIARYKEIDPHLDPQEQLFGIKIDLDASKTEVEKNDFSSALQDARDLRGYFTCIWRLNGSEIQYFYSGGRSIHIVIEPEVLDIKPHEKLHLYIQEVMRLIEEHRNLKTLDDGIYKRRGLYREVNTKHSGTKRYKVELSSRELDLSVAEIIKISESNREPLNEGIELTKNEDAAKAFAELFDNAKKIVDNRTKEIPLTQDQLDCLKNSAEDYSCIKDICNNGPHKVDGFNNAAQVLVTYLRAKGIDRKQIASNPLSLSLAKNTKEGITSKNERERIQNIKSIINTVFDNDYKFGCGYARGLGDKKSPIKCNPKCPLKLLSVERPKIYITSGDMEKRTAEAWNAIEIANAKDPYLFSFGGAPFRIEFDIDKNPKLSELDEARLRYELELIIDWRKVTGNDDKKKDVSTIPPLHIIRNILASRDRNLPVLEKITETPIYAKDGTLNMKIGYNEKTRTYLSNKKNFPLIEAPIKPTEKEVAEAKKLVEEIFCNFPFVDEKEKCHAIAFQFLPFVRDMISGPTPMHLVEKSTEGTGASLLVQAAAHVATGQDPSLFGEGRDRDEWRKRLTSILRDSPTIINIDNIIDRLDSSALSIALTSSHWDDRVLGLTQNIKLPIRCTWAATGNNPHLSGEITRRSIRIRLDAKVEFPHLRPTTAFLHPDLITWIDENRPTVVSAIYTLINNWIVKGKPLGDKILGGYEQWSMIIGGILKINGFPGFLENLSTFYESSNIEGSNNLNFVSAWWDITTRQGKSIVGVSDLYGIACSDASALYLGQSNEEQARKIALGRAIKKLEDRYYTIKEERDEDTPKETPVKESIVVQVKYVGTRGRARHWMLKVVKKEGECEEKDDLSESSEYNELKTASAEENIDEKH